MVSALFTVVAGGTIMFGCLIYFGHPVTAVCLGVAYCYAAKILIVNWA